jgi:hypothetical protein
MADTLASMGVRDTGLQAFAPVVFLPDSLAADSLSVLPDSTEVPPDSLAAPPDTASTTPPDTSAVVQEAPSDTTGAANQEAPPDTSGSAPAGEAGRDTSRTPGN